MSDILKKAVDSAVDAALTPPKDPVKSTGRHHNWSWSLDCCRDCGKTYNDVLQEIKLNGTGFDTCIGSTSVSVPTYPVPTLPDNFQLGDTYKYNTVYTPKLEAPPSHSPVHRFVCECGGDATNSTHYSWCPKYGGGNGIR